MRQDIQRSLLQLADDLREQATESNHTNPNPNPTTPLYPYKDGHAYKAILGRFGINLSLPVLREIANEVATTTRSRIDREAKRRKDLLYKWLDEHYDGLDERLPHLSLLNSESEEILAV
jgi:hypothetical protein